MLSIALKINLKAAFVYFLKDANFYCFKITLKEAFLYILRYRNNLLLFLAICFIHRRITIDTLIIFYILLYFIRQSP